MTVLQLPVLPALEITAPKLEYGLLLPFIVVFAAACVGVLVEAVAPRAMRHSLGIENGAISCAGFDTSASLKIARTRMPIADRRAACARRASATGLSGERATRR